MRRTIVLLFLIALSSTVWGQDQTKKILLSSPDPALFEELKSVTPLARIVPVTGETAAQQIADADAFIGNITPALVQAGKNLKWVQVMSAGVESVLHMSGGTDLRDSDIVLTNNQIVQGPEIADHAMAMLLTLTRDIDAFLEYKRQEVWQRGGYEGIELNGRTAVVIGVGGIGTQIAFRAWAHGMTVIGVDPEDIPFMPVISKVVKPDVLHSVLPQADVVFVSAPHTALSHKMLGPKEFGLMKKGSYFIAVSRGRLYDVDALVQALKAGNLAGAGVDVTDPEPLPKGHPLWKCDNVVITPHVAGRSDKDRARMVGTIKDNIRRFVEGRPLVNVVDKQKGY
ncbi:MAG: D-2-hydroxyacid dehydrogenase [Acidobacteria bacterium]|nr:MAG: D-2-hydroxyacid dehydrogenase [Acidobacteriota bacterium]